MKNNPYTEESIKASFFFSKSVRKSVKRGERVFSVSSQSRSLFSAGRLEKRETAIPNRNGNRNRNRKRKRNGKRNLYINRDNIYLNLS